MTGAGLRDGAGGDMRLSVGETLAALLQRLGGEFKADRLAYLSLTAKNESLLCGALARLMHEAYADRPHTQIRREWWRSASNAYFDVAVLTRGAPVALIEAKAAMSFDLVKGGGFPAKDVLKDVDRLRGVEFAGERYALLFVTHPHEMPRLEFDIALPYIAGMRRHGAIERARIDAGFGHFIEAAGGLPVLAAGEIPAGTAFDVDVSVFYWLLSVSD